MNIKIHSLVGWVIVAFLLVVLGYKIHEITHRPPSSSMPGIEIKGEDTPLPPAVPYYEDICKLPNPPSDCKKG